MPEPNYEAMSDAELRALVEQDLFQTPTQQRDEQGRFTKADEQPKEDATADEVEEIVYRREIDLGDGSGKQVFEAPSMEELIDKLATAQEHATRKIREQAQQLKEKPQPTPVTPKELTPEEKFILQQRMQREPEKVLAEMVQREVEERERVRREEEQRQQEQIAQQKTDTDQWVASNTDYYASEKNGKRMMKYLETYGLELSPENLTTAFNDLNESGLLEVRPTETAAAPQEVETQETRIAEAPKVATTVVRRKVVGGLSTKRSTPVTPKAPGLTEDELNKMPLHELEAMMYQHYRQ